MYQPLANIVQDFVDSIVSISTPNRPVFLIPFQLEEPRSSGIARIQMYLPRLTWMRSLSGTAELVY